MPVQIGGKLDAGFNDPIGMLTDCHRRIERFLDVLCNVAEHARERRLTQEETSAVQTSLKYFREGGVRHTADEEQSLFPRLRTAAGEQALSAVEHLEKEHREADQHHANADRIYSEWIRAGSISASEHDDLLVSTRRLRELYADHIRAEEQTVFPIAAQVLDARAIAAIGEEFRARRQAK
jgi:hemerythrin-like domain-containing protein